MAGGLINTGTTLVHMGRYEQAKEHLDSGMKLAEKMGFRDFVMSGYEAYIMLYEKTGDEERTGEYRMLLDEMRADLSAPPGERKDEGGT